MSYLADNDLPTQFADWLAWVQLWSKETPLPNVELGLVSLISAGVNGGIKIATGKPVVERLARRYLERDEPASALIRSDNRPVVNSNTTMSIFNTPGNSLSSLVVQIWLLLDSVVGVFDGQTSQNEFNIHVLKVAQYFGIADNEIIECIGQALAIVQGIRVAARNGRESAAEHTEWDEGLCSELLLELHQAVFDVPDRRHDLPDSVALPGGKSPPSVAGLNWKALGFQGANPTTDFRGMGFYALRQFHGFCTVQPREAGNVIVESRNSDPTAIQAGEPWYMPALVSIHISRMILELLESGLLIGYIVSEIGSGLTEKLVSFPLHSDGRADDPSSEQQSQIFNDDEDQNHMVDFHSRQGLRQRKLQDQGTGGSAEETARLLGDDTSHVENDQNGKRTRKPVTTKECWLPSVSAAVDPTEKSANRLHQQLMCSWHGFWQAKVATGELKSVMETEQALQEFRKTVVARLWENSL